ncbi:hypothetical protein PVK73_23140 [Bacillus thuringiensis]
MFFKRKKKKEQNKKWKQEHGNRNSDCTTNDMWPHHTMTLNTINSNATYGSYDSSSHSSSCSSHSLFDSGSS